MSDAGGHLTVYSWASLSAKMRAPGETLAPQRVATLSGTATASLVADVSNDGNRISCTPIPPPAPSTSSTARISPSRAACIPARPPRPWSWATSTATPTRTWPWPTGAGIPSASSKRRRPFSRSEYAAAGEPAALAAADFGRDGRTDLAVGLADRKALAVWKAAAGGSFDPGQAQWIYFQNPPSALSADNFDGPHGPDVLLGFADFYKLALRTPDAAGALGYAYAINTWAPSARPGQPRHPDRERRPERRRRHRLRRRCSRAGVAALPAALQPGPLPPQRQPVLFVVDIGARPACSTSSSTTTPAPWIRRDPVLGLRAAVSRYLADPTLFGPAVASRPLGPRLDHPGRHLRLLAGQRRQHPGLPRRPAPADIRAPAPASSCPPAPTRCARSCCSTRRRTRPRSPSSASAGAPSSSPWPSCWRAGPARCSTWPLPAGPGRRGLSPGVGRPPDRRLPALRRRQSWPPSTACPAGRAPTLFAPTGLGRPRRLLPDLLTLVNPSAREPCVSLGSTDAGQLLGNPRPPHPVPARAKLSPDFVTLFGATVRLTGYLVVQPQGPGTLAGAVTFGEAGAGRFLSSLPLSEAGAADYLVGHIANGTLGPVASSPAWPSSTPTTPNTPSASPPSTSPASPSPPSPTPSPPTAARSSSSTRSCPASPPVFGGYLRVEDLTDPAAQLRVFALFGHPPLNFLSAVAAQPVGVRSEQGTKRMTEHGQREIADCGFRIPNAIRNPQSAIRNPVAQRRGGRRAKPAGDGRCESPVSNPESRSGRSTHAPIHRLIVRTGTSALRFPAEIRCPMSDVRAIYPI